MKVVPHLPGSANSASTAWRSDGELVLAQDLKQARFERDAELKHHTQIGMPRLERDHVCIDLWLLDADSAEQLGKSATGFTAQAGKDLGDQSDQSLGRGGRRIEMPRGHIPLLEDQ